MQTKEFNENLDPLIDMIQLESKEGGRLADMCAKALPWRCHRSLVSDALAIRGFIVAHIMSLTDCKAREITSFGIFSGKKTTCPRQEQNTLRGTRTN